MDIISIILTYSIQHPELLKDFFFFFLAWFLMKKGIEKNFDKIIKSLENLTSTLASLEQNHNTRLTNLEVKVDKLAQHK